MNGCSPTAALGARGGSSLIRYSGFAVRRLVGLAFALFGFRDLLQAGELGTLIETDECNTLRSAPHLAYLGNAGTNQHAGGRDQHDLILGADERLGLDLAVALGRLDRDHHLRVAAVSRVLGDRRALAVAVLGRGEHGLLLAAG